ncbi:SRPBCC family protein [Croceimicrobium sp.]|uniref:SRPBCC family protein n=1 Tax=Croceimicrobium sp. TaxID=2828340 RepID=UPI003BAA44C9
MELKTQVKAGQGQQEIVISRQFDLPLELLFKAFTEADLFAQWMGTKVLKLEAEDHGSYRFETTDPSGKVVFSANGTFHEIEMNRKIVRTFQMEGTPFPAQLEFLEFESLSEHSSLLNMQIIFRSEAFRDQLLQMPFASGLSMAHDRLQNLMTQ